MQNKDRYMVHLDVTQMMTFDPLFLLLLRKDIYQVEFIYVEVVRVSDSLDEFVGGHKDDYQLKFIHVEEIKTWYRLWGSV